jgi:hypothetical protein
MYTNKYVVGKLNCPVLSVCLFLSVLSCRSVLDLRGDGSFCQRQRQNRGGRGRESFYSDAESDIERRKSKKKKVRETIERMKDVKRFKEKRGRKLNLGLN